MMDALHDRIADCQILATHQWLAQGQIMSRYPVFQTWLQPGPAERRPVRVFPSLSTSHTIPDSSTHKPNNAIVRLVRVLMMRISSPLRCAPSLRTIPRLTEDNREQDSTGDT